MRILTIVNNFPSQAHLFEGMYNLQHVRALRELGHEVLVLRYYPWAPRIGTKWRRYASVPDCYTFEDVRVKTLRAFVAPRMLGVGTLREQLSARLKEEAATFGAHVAHAHGLIPAGVMALGAGIPSVVTAHGSDAYRTPWRRKGLEALARSIVKDASRVCAVSDFIAANVKRLGRRDVQVIFNGADSTLFAPRSQREARRRLNLPLEGNIVTYVGRIERDKGLLELAQALGSLKRLRPHLVIAGVGGFTSELNDSLQQQNIDATWLGAVEQKRLGDVFAVADVFVLPSYYEGLPTVLCEAMNVGTAIVATRVGGVPEIIKDGETGLLVEPRDVPALTEKIGQLLSDPPLQTRLATAAQVFAVKNLTWQINARRYSEIYETISASTIPAAEPISFTRRLDELGR